MGSDELWNTYLDPEEWADITPLPQNDGINSVVKIAYSDECKYQHILLPL